MKKEYKLSVNELTPENKKIILKMKRYLSARHLNEVVFDELMSDLIGMAIESQSRGESFSDTVGMDYNAFCKELVSNSPRQTAVERVLEILQWISWCGGCLVPVLYLFTLIFNKLSPAESNGLLFVTPVQYIAKYSIILFIVVLGGFFVRRSAYKSQKAVLCVYIAAIVLTVMLSDFLAQSFFDGTISINMLIWIALFASAALILFIIKRVVAAMIARNYKRGQ